MPAVMDRPTGSRLPAPDLSGAAVTPTPTPTPPPPAPTPSRAPLPPPAPRADHPAPLARPCWPQLAGRLLALTGAVLVAFALFQVWGTAALEWRAQRSIERQLDRQLAASPGHQLGSYALPANGSDGADAGSPGSPGSPADADTDVVTTPARPGSGLGADRGVGDVAREGEPLGRIEIPAIGVAKDFLEGVDRDVLREGPGHYPGTARPGHAGNTAIAGHRTTHGGPFADLDRLQPGDEIVVETADGRFRYQVDGHPEPDGSVSGHTIVDPAAVEVLADTGGNRLTLTACHPKYSARQRIVVTATLIGDPLPSSPAATPTSGSPDGTAHGATAAAATPGSAPVLADTAGSAPAPAATPATGPAAPAGPDLAAPGWIDGERALGWQPGQAGPTVLWATVTLLIGHASWILVRLWRRRAAWLPLAPALAASLFVCFMHLDRLLPAF